MAIQGAPYVGVTGFKDVDEIHNIIWRLADSHQGRLEARPLMVGVLVNNRTLGNDETEHRSARFPSMENVRSVFQQASDQGNLMTLRLAHFNTHFPESLGNQLISLAEQCFPYIEGVQLNCCWPDPKQLEAVRPEFRRIVLQIGSKALADCKHDPKQIVERLRRYSGLITDVLIDPSGGTGQFADFQIMRPVLHAIKNWNYGIGLGVAGGLCADNVNCLQLRLLFQEFPNLSIDAEGRLRTENDQKLELIETESYITKAFSTVEKVRHEQYLMREAERLALES